MLIPHSVITTGDKNLLYYFHKLLITYLCVYLSSFVGCLLFGARKSHHHQYQNFRYCCRVPITALPCWNKLITCFCLGLARYLRCKSFLLVERFRALVKLLYQKISYVVSPTQNGPTFKVQAQ